MFEDKPKVVIIGGPTASGKSALAVELAFRFNGEIINADSMQVYRGMDIGTAKPTAEERKGIPHHLIDVVDPDEEFNAAVYRSLAVPAIREIASQGKVPFIIGGTGLYIKTLLGGLIKCPPSDLDLRRELQRQYEEKGAAFLHKELRRIDPAAALNIHPNDRVRIIRALEIIHLTGKRLSALTSDHGFSDRPFQALKICLKVDREQLYQRINNRSLAMIEKGLIQETEALVKKGYSPELKSMKSLGYRHIIKFLEGEWDLDRAIACLQRDTRRYAKRQLTWFRADPKFYWMRPEEKGKVWDLIAGFLKEDLSTRENSQVGT
jgi:tRNA dimethylallyltransferase